MRKPTRAYCNHERRTFKHPGRIKSTYHVAECGARIKTLPPEARAALRALLLEIRADARQRAEKCWKKHKAPMAAYWKALSVYAGHTARLCK